MDMDRVDWDLDFEDDADESVFEDEQETLIEFEAGQGVVRQHRD